MEWSATMPEKSKTTKKKSPAVAARSVKAAARVTPNKSHARPKVAKAKMARRKPAFYVTWSCSTTISNEKPKVAIGSREFRSFDEARQAAIDEIVAAIETAEAQLLSLKRASQYEDLPVNGAAV
jgi:hypothetical protein